MVTKLQRATACLALVLIAAAASAAGAAPSAQGTVNINTADAATLALLPRIGPAVAERVVAHREQNGPFKTIEDLMLVKGIGERTFELLRPYVVLDGKTTLADKVSVPRAPKNEPAKTGER